MAERNAAMPQEMRMRFATESDEAAHYNGSKLKSLEMEEQARVRYLVFRGLLVWDKRESTTGVPITYVKIVEAL